MEVLLDELTVDIQYEIKFYPGDKGDFQTPPSNDEFELLNPSWDHEKFTEKENEQIKAFVETQEFFEKAINEYLNQEYEPSLQESINQKDIRTEAIEKHGVKLYNR